MRAGLFVYFAAVTFGILIGCTNGHSEMGFQSNVASRKSRALPVGDLGGTLGSALGGGGGLTEGLTGAVGGSPVGGGDGAEGGEGAGEGGDAEKPAALDVLGIAQVGQGSDVLTVPGVAAINEDNPPNEDVLANVGLITDEQNIDGFDTKHGKIPIVADVITGSRHYHLNASDDDQTYTQQKSILDVAAGILAGPDKITIHGRKPIEVEKGKKVVNIPYPPHRYQAPPHLFGLQPFKPEPSGTCTDYKRCHPLIYNSSYESVASPFLYGTQYASKTGISILVFSDNSYAPGNLQPEFDTENNNGYLKLFHDNCVKQCPVMHCSSGNNAHILNDQTNVYKLDSVSCDTFYTALRLGELQRDQYNTLNYGGFTIDVQNVAGAYWFKNPVSKDEAKQLVDTENVQNLYEILADRFGANSGYAVFTLHQNITSLCTPEKIRCKPPQCSNSKLYTNDGTCNSPTNPIAGKNPTSLLRLGRPYCTLDGGRECSLPNPRVVSLTLGFITNFIIYPKEAYYAQTPDSPEYPCVLSLFGLFMFQFNMMDTVKKQTRGINYKPMGGLRSCTSDGRHLPANLRSPYSAPIHIACDDPYYSQFNVTCLNYNKAQLYNGDCSVQNSNLGNFVTSYSDLDQLYPTDYCKIKGYIAKGGKIKESFDGFPYIADSRAYASAPLLVVYTLWALLHNVIAEKVQASYGNLTDYEIFQKARGINIYVYQYFLDNHVLPNILGKEYSPFQGITSVESCYDSKLDPTTITEFACAAGPAMNVFYPDKFFVLHPDYSVKTIRHFSDGYGGPELAFHDFANAYRGLIFQPINVLGHGFEAQNEAFKLKNNYGVDIFALDIQQSRDCCLQPYIYYIKKFFAVVINTWEDLEQYISPEAIILLKRIYSDVSKVELYAGISVEKKYQEGWLGAVGRKIVTEQYLHYKCGDAKHYTNVLDEASKKCLADIDYELLFATLAGVNTYTKDLFAAGSTTKDVFNVSVNATPYAGIDCLVSSVASVLI